MDDARVDEGTVLTAGSHQRTELQPHSNNATAQLRDDTYIDTAGRGEVGYSQVVVNTARTHLLHECRAVRFNVLTNRAAKAIQPTSASHIRYRQEFKATRD